MEVAALVIASSDQVVVEILMVMDQRGTSRNVGSKVVVVVIAM